MKIVYMGMCMAGFPMRTPIELKSLKGCFFRTFLGMQYLENWIQVTECVREIQENAKGDFDYAALQSDVASIIRNDVFNQVLIKSGGERNIDPNELFVLKTHLKGIQQDKRNKFLKALQTAVQHDPYKDCGKPERAALNLFFKQIDQIIFDRKKVQSRQYCGVEEWICFFRQKAWLLWLQNFFCSIIDRQISQYKVQSSDTLFLVTLPEFSILDYPLDYGSTTAFVLKTLLSEWDKDLQEINWPFGDKSKRARGALSSFKDLTRKYSNLLLIPGTAVWKAQDAKIRCFYNTVMVYWRGNVIKVWDKQLISDADGICSAHDPKHLQFSYSSVRGGGTALVGSYLAADFLSRMEQGHVYGPVFEIAIGKEKIKFGISICLDDSRPDFFDFDGIPGTIDFQILIACGSCMEDALCENGDNKTPRLRASRGLFYCDAMSMDVSLLYAENSQHSNIAAAVWYYDINCAPIDRKKVKDFKRSQKDTFDQYNLNNHQGAIQLHRWKDEIKFREPWRRF